MVLPQVEFVSCKADRPGLIKIDGGTFQSGSDVMRAFPLEETEVEPFYIESEEVTVGQFKKVMGRVPGSMSSRFPNGVVPDEIPVTNVPYELAVEYAERIGMRLPTLDEYLFLATNGGTTKFPWGDDADVIQEWPVDIVTPPKFDCNLPKFGQVKGLYSRTAEWTQSLARRPKATVNGKKDNTRAIETAQFILEDKESMRFVVGGNNWALANDPRKKDKSILGPRGFMLLRLEDNNDYDGLGFRCAKSVRPRFYDNELEK